MSFLDATMQTVDYLGVILAAGKGARMAPFGEHFPKPMLPICNQPLIVYHLQSLATLGIREVIVLVGHKGYEISKMLGDGSRFGIRIRYVEQTSYLGIAHAVGCLERHIDRPFLLMLGDIYFRQPQLAPMFDLLRRQGGGAVLGVKQEPNPDLLRRNFSVEMTPEGRVTRVVEKPRFANTSVKGIGLYLFDLTVFDAIRATPRTAMRDEYELTHSIQIMVLEGQPVSAAFVVQDDVNLTYPIDLLRCNLEEAYRVTQGSVVGKDVRLHPQATILHSVIGNHVQICHPIRISRSLIFDNTAVTSQEDLDGQILTPEGFVDCSAEDLPLNPSWSP